MSDVALFLAPWMAQQRWYATKGEQPSLSVVATLESGALPERVVTYLLLDEAPLKPVLYQVPVVFRDAPRPEGGASLVGEFDGAFVYDGPHDPAYTADLLTGISTGRRLERDGVSAEGHALREPGRMLRSAVLRGEQSNTSIIYDVEGGPSEHVIVKVFRVLHHGDNPDVTTQAALSSGGSHRVPTSFGFLTGSWPDAGREDGVARGHLAFAQEFLPGLEDAWRVALRSAAAGEDFRTAAYDLGVATAEVHATLATALPTVPAGPDEIAGALVSMRRRITTASREVPGVADYAERIDAVYDVVAERPWPRLQRIHGDLHLGQALSSPELGWVLLDFEGEPLRPMPERSRPDVTLRDVAGMLRSFDYVAGSLAHEQPPVHAESWASAARHAYVDGYNASSGQDVRAERALLDAFEIDKAVYEAIYESRNRPDWLGIPLAAIERLVARSAPAERPAQQA